MLQLQIRDDKTHEQYVQSMCRPRQLGVTTLEHTVFKWLSVGRYTVVHSKCNNDCDCSANGITKFGCVGCSYLGDCFLLAWHSQAHRPPRFHGAIELLTPEH